MFANSIDYTVCSTDPQHYNRISCNLTAPITKYSALLVSSLTANCCIVVLNKDDYIEIDNVKYSFGQDYSNINADTFSTLLNQLFEDKGSLLHTELDGVERLKFTYTKPFEINSMTYNFSLITGFYNTALPIKSTSESGENVIIAESVGFTLSTPILYLTSNVAVQSYRNLNEADLRGEHCGGNCVGSKIVMRLNNSFSHGFPIYISNADFETTLLSNDLASLEFRLVDANMREILLLSPLYLCIHVRGIPDDTIVGAFLQANNE